VDQSITRPLSAHRTTQTQIKHIQTSMSSEGFELTTPVLASNLTGTVIGTHTIIFTESYKLSTLVKNAVFWDVATCGFCKNRRFRNKYRLYSFFQLLVTAKVVPRSLILFLPLETTRSSKTPVFTRVTRRHIPEDGSLVSHRRKNHKSYTEFISLAQLTDTVFSVRYEPQILHNNHIP
jgi:hypothetical protein